MDKLLNRPGLTQRAQQALQRSPITALLGPRQCGKTTLARLVTQDLADGAEWFDLEDPRDVRRLEHPMTVLEPLRGLVVIDEVQRMPDIFPLLRVLVDRPGRPARFLILGSAAPDLLQQSSESLAGRVEFIELTGFTPWETREHSKVWIRGGFPPAYLAQTEIDSVAWREQFIQTFLERDLGLLDSKSNPSLMRRLWTMLAHYHGQTLNAAALSQSLGLTQKAVRRYIDLLTGTYMIRQLHPWFTNVGKRLVKSPKIYLRDTGILHTLLGIDTQAQLEAHPKVGASWEGFALEQAVQVMSGDPYFWATHNGAEVDLVLQRRRQAWGFEFKRADAPGLTRSMRSGLTDLQLDHLWVVYPGSKRYALAERVTVIPLSELAELAAV